jgi:WD40 repeat protein
VQAWDLATGRERSAVTLRQNCWSLTESPDGRILAAAGFGWLHLIEWRGDSMTAGGIDHPGNMVALSFSRDGKLLCTTANDQQSRIWEIATRKLLCGMPGPWQSDARFLPDEKFLATVGDSGFQVWDAKTGLAISPLIAPGAGHTPNLQISPDGRWAVYKGGSAPFGLVHIDQHTSAAGGTPDDALLWCELLSNARIEGSNLVYLSADEWLDRWHKYRERHPDLLRNEFVPSPPSQRPTTAPARG